MTPVTPHRTDLFAFVILFCLLADTANSEVVRTNFGENLVLENVSTNVRYEGRDLNNHMRTRNSYSIEGWTHDGKALLFGYRGKLWRQKNPTGKRTEELDLGEQSVNDARPVYMCGRPAFVFSNDEEGDEYNTLFVAERKSLKSTKISEDGRSNRAIRVSNDGEQIVYASAKANTGVWEIFHRTLCGETENHLVYRSVSPLYPSDFHPNGSRILAIGPANGGARISEIDLQTGEELELFLGFGKINSALYDASGRYVFFTTNSDREFIELYRLDRETNEIIPVLSDLGFDIDTISLSDDRALMAVLLNRSGFSSIVVIDANALQLVSAPSQKTIGVVSGVKFAPDGDKLALRVSQPMVPARSGLYDISSREFEPWSGGFSAGQERIILLPEISTYPTFDSDHGKTRQIPMLVYRPSTASEEKPVPVLIIAHGGPEGQSRPNWSRFNHYLVTQLGIAVIRPNIRGSTGYGRTFEELDETVKREDAIKDIGALLDWVETQPGLDSNRVAISGGSYGGFVSLASLVAYSDRLRGGISSVGISDFSTFMQNTEAYRVDNRRREYGDERVPEVAEFFERISPLRNAHKIDKPVLIIQGANDPRVPQQQAEDMITAIRANGVEVSYVLAMNEGHGFRKPENRRFASGAQIAFLKEILFED